MITDVDVPDAGPVVDADACYELAFDLAVVIICPSLFNLTGVRAYRRGGGQYTP